MAFQKVSELNADTTVSLGGVNRKTGKANPTKIEGYYLGRKAVPDDKKKSGVSYIYFLQTPKGNVGVWGKTDLDRKMGSVANGTMIRITQNGFQKTKNGDMYKYDVEFDPDNTIEVATGNLDTPAEEGYNDETELDAFADEDDSADEDEAQNAALAAAERRAKVAALLGKNKNAKN